jgi:uncharacterized cupin superfamily protein
MFIKLINASPPFQDKTVVIKKDIIVSIFETEIEFPVTPAEDNVVEMARKEKATAIFCGTVGAWYVKETVEEVYSLL